MWPIETIVRNLSFLSSDDKLRLQAEVSRRLIDELAAAGAQASSEVLALDWFNGRRYPEVNEELKGALFALDLGSDAPAIFRALVLATAFGSRRIFDSLAKSGLEIDHIIAAGGISQRSPFVMHMRCKLPVCGVFLSVASYQRVFLLFAGYLPRPRMVIAP